jgi:hypothetical protein
MVIGGEFTVASRRYAQVRAIGCNDSQAMPAMCKATL